MSGKTTPYEQYQRGDMVFAAVDLCNDELADDGSSLMPEAAPHALLAAAGTRGMVINIGHPVAAPEQIIYLVSFETGEERELGLPFGCLPEELTQQQPG
jgi:nitrogen fixation protein NifZ